MTSSSQSAGGLFASLQEKIEGEIRWDPLTLQLYSTDASDYRKVPAAVVIPKSVNDVAAAIKIAGRYGNSVIPRGGGSSLSGQTVGPGIVVDQSKYLNRIQELNLEEQWVWAESGLVLDSLNARLAPHGLMVGPDPSSSAMATLGGMVGNNSTGSHSIKYGMIADHLLALEVVLSDGSIAVFDSKDERQVADLIRQPTAEGRIYRRMTEILKAYEQDIATHYPRTWRNVAGYGLNRLAKSWADGAGLNLAKVVAGSEGTLAYVTRIKLALVPKPQTFHILVLHFDDLPASLSVVPHILTHPVAAVELMTYETLKLAHEHKVFGPRLRKFVDGLPGAVLLVEFAGESAQTLAQQAANLEDALRAEGYTAPVNHCVTPEAIERVWNLRKSVLGLLVSRPGDTRRISIVDDPTVPVDQLVDFTQAVQAAGKALGVAVNFDAHVSAGCLHTCPELNLKTAEGLQRLETLAKKVIEIVVAHHGTSTGEHGEGIARSYFNAQVYGPRLHQAFREVKAAFDPINCMNPGKIIDAPEPWDTDWLKYHPGYRTPHEPKETILDFSDYGGYAGLVQMCNGQGSCRSQVHGTMCPSYRVTREEVHTTRGRANALRAAITGDLDGMGLTSEKVHQALDLCVECKACRNECSTRVDVAKLKYEFLNVYQAKHGVPLRSRLFANLERLDKIAALAPGLTNRLYRNNGFRRLLDQTVRIDRRRRLPALAEKSFQHWFYHRPSNRRPAPRGPVVLWDDCHISHHEIDLGKAAVTLLEAAGFEVLLIKGRRCCGRPMISKGLLEQARRNALHNIALLTPLVRQGIPVVGVEPSCVTCFKDEYPQLVRGDEAGLVSANSFFFEEFIANLAEKGELDLPFSSAQPRRRILVHTHCYQKALGTASHVIAMLRLLPGAQVDEIPAGCCGMAGAFGYEKEHYDISMAMGEQVLFPTVRAAPADTVISAAGTSCRTQIKDGTQRQAVHPIMLLAKEIDNSRQAWKHKEISHEEK